MSQMTARGQAEAVEMGWFGDGLGTFSNLAEHMRDMADMTGDVDPAVTGNLNRQHANSDQIYDGRFKLADRNQSIGDLDTDQERLKLLDKFTQNDSKVGDPGGMSNTRCGSTTLIAAAIQGGGTDGIKAILDQSVADLDKDGPYYEKQKAQLEALQKSMKDGGDLKMSDLHSLNSVLSQQLLADTQKSFLNDGSPKTDEDGNPYEVPVMGATPDILKAYIEKNPTMKGYFADGHMSIDSVDDDGKTEEGADNGGDHFVLHIAGQEGGSAIYDPFARKDGHQLVFNPEEQKNYARHEVKSDQIDGADFGGSAFMGMYD